MEKNMNCDATREHLDACEDCRLHVAVEARLRTQPVLDPPKGLVARVMRALPRAVPLRREFVRLAAAATILVGLAVGAVAFKLGELGPVSDLRTRIEHTFEAGVTTLNPFK